MPTLAVIAGSDHQVLFTDVGYTNGDTADMATAIHGFFNSTAVNELPAEVSTLNVFPNPATTQFNLQLNLKQAADVTIELFALNGEKVSVLVNEKMNAGLVQKPFSATAFAPGLYFVKTTVNGTSSFSKVNISH
jgi:hypothetical protein